MDERQRLERVLQAVQEIKAEDVVIYDMEERSSITDYVLICSGRSQAHVRGISERIGELMKAAGAPAASMEGFSEGSWVLLDFDLVLVHVFHPETRAYYDLDGLLAEHYPARHVETPAPAEPAREDLGTTP